MGGVQNGQIIDYVILEWPLSALINSSQTNFSKLEIWYREGPQKLKTESIENSVNLKQKIKLRVAFPSEKYVEFGRQIEIWVLSLFRVFNFL